MSRALVLAAAVVALALGGCAIKHDLQGKPVRFPKLKAVGALDVAPAAAPASTPAK